MSKNQIQRLREEQNFKIFLPIFLHHPFFITNVVFLLRIKKSIPGIQFYFIMANNQYFNNVLLRNIDNEIPFRFN